MLKRSLIVMIVMVIVITSFPITSAMPNVYQNGTPSSWSLNDINLLASYNTLRQEAFGNYKGQITRLEFIYLAVNIYEILKNKPIDINPSIKFSDTNDIYALKGASIGITTGIGDGKFGPKQLLTREQLATMMVKMIELSGIQLEASTNKFSDDFLISNYAKSAIYKASNYGILNGHNNSVNPKGFATNEQALIIYKSIYDRFTVPKVMAKMTSEQIGELSSGVVKIYVDHNDGSASTGSGFFYDYGKIGTNFHVIDNAKKIVIEFEDGTFYEGRILVLGYDRALDLAALSIDKANITPLNLGNSDKVKKGQKVFAIGSPIGLMNTLSSGIISSVRNNEIQIDAAISPGSSGGVLLDETGSIVGITNAGILEGENLGFAIPVNLFRNLPKMQKLTLSQFVDASVLKPEMPTGVTARFDGKSSVLLYWDDMSVDYYVVYESVDDGEFQPIVDSDGYNIWWWAQDYCLEITDHSPDRKVVYAIASVLGDAVSDYVYTQPIMIPKTNETIKNSLSDTDVIVSYLNKNYSNHAISGKTIVTDYFDAYWGDDGELIVIGYLGYDALLTYLSLEEKALSQTMLSLKSRAAAISKYYQVPVAFYYVYSDYYVDYPDVYETNSLYDAPVTWDSDSALWEVFFPLVEYDTALSTYTTWSGASKTN